MKNLDNRWLFLLVSILIFIVIGRYVGVLDKAIDNFVSMVSKMIPILILIWLLMILMDYFVSPKKLVGLMEKYKGITGWCIAIVAGLLSMGAGYIWYPILKEAKKHGLKDDVITIFLYNRAIKLHLLPMMIYYFGWMYTVILTIVMIVISVVNGIVVRYILEIENGRDMYGQTATGQAC